MANTKPALQAQITIDSTNKYLDVTSATNGSETVTLTEQDYDDIHSLLSSLQTGLQTLGDDWSSATCTVSDTGTVTIDSGQSSNAVGLEWNGGSNSANTIGTILGYDTSTDDSGAYSYAADYQHQYGWYPHRYPVRMGPWKPSAIGGELRHTLTGDYSKKLHVAFHHTYDVAFEMLDPEYVFTDDATGSDSNKDAEHVWKEAAQGNYVTWYPDASDTSTSTKCYLVSPYDWGSAVSRPHTDYEAYDLSMTFREQES